MADDASFAAKSGKWLACAPPGWSVARLKDVCRAFVAGGTPESDNPAHWADGEDGTPWVAIGDMTAGPLVTRTDRALTPTGLASKRLTVLPSGTILYSMYASLGKVAVLAMPAATNQAILGVVPDDRRLEATFLRWWLESLEPHVRQFSSSNTQDNLNAETVRNMPLYLPSMFEQRKIADFLDRETERIDALVAKKEHLIELLQEKRTALISHAVTKGLDADAPMKDSGIEWLGEVPEAWQVTPLKHLLLSIEQGWSPQCEERQKGKDEWGVLKAGCANGGKFRDSEHKALPSSLEPDARLEVHQGDVLMSRANTRDLVGAAAFVDTTPPRLLLCDKLYRLRPRTDSLQPRYLAYYLESRLSRYQLERDATGASDSMQNISQTVVRLLALPAPPLPEQCQIVTALDAEMLRLSKLTRLTKLALARLQEYRSALITAAVTGQIDVREYAKEAS